MTEPQGAVVLERRTDDGEDVHADRVTADGEVWRWTTVRAGFDASGEVVFHRGPGTWEHLGTLGADALSDLHAAIAASDAAALPDVLRPEAAGKGGVTDTWTVAGRTVVVAGGGTGAAAPLEALREALDAAVAAAAA